MKNCDNSHVTLDITYIKYVLEITDKNYASKLYAEIIKQKKNIKNFLTIIITYCESK